MAAPPPWRSGAASNGYTSVEARRSFAAPRTVGSSTTTTTAAATSPTGGGAAKTTFPDPLKQYVARTFENIAEADKKDVEIELKRIITDAFNEKVVWSINWDEMPLPQVILQKRRNSQGQQVTNSDKSPPLKSFGKFSISDTKKRKSAGDDTTITNKYTERSDKKARQQSPYTGFSDKLSQRDKEKRATRFAKELRAVTPPIERNINSTTHMDIDVAQPLVGRCMTLEKRYLRLTSAPDPDNVRPLHVLEKTLELLKKKWREEQNYAYICDQFKSLRQDLTVQHIKTEFTVSVYEIHARIALEKGDLGEYNQCQSQLANLYAEGFTGQEEEFKAYRILYLLHTCNRADMNELLAILTPTDKQHPNIQHSLQVRSALAAGNYHKFFRLYLDAPSMGGYLMDSFAGRERIAALACICRAYRPDIDIRFLTEELGFESDKECVEFLCDHGAEELIQQKVLDNGTTSIRLNTQKASPIFEQAKQNAFKKVDIKGQL
ncbi:Similar to THP3 homolog C2A9.11c; acc. no. Q1MTP1 [Pyronema omphalodes CBS 100304]|uniref:Similar to THP3 homolog C2A9.11c acc. no. Q1MTP1 n=1 Tax=Pyronema omphalodes (strain CBS 100304) TaxID=1076935 RepID=U4L8R9_PYROM|nr:Similar to THP3 homolog C2A9.11c; acc. no. Q1MTP1 [Pyronema omphalodes CBS 100304]